MKKTKHDKRKNQAGSALVVAICITALLLLSGVVLTRIAGQSAFTARKLKDGTQALSIAEGGIADTLEKLRLDYATWSQNTNAGTLGVGRYVVVTTPGAGGSVLLTATGYVGDDERTTVLEVLGDKYAAYNKSMGVGAAVLSGGDATLLTAALTINGALHANGNIISDNTPTEVNGAISTSGTLSGKFDDKKYTSLTTGVDPVVIPEFELDIWRDLALNGGSYYNGSQVFGNVNLLPGNGVVYVEGDIEISQNSSLTGTLVASGSITINNRFSHTSYDASWPSLVAGVDVNLHNLNTYNGMIYAGNNVLSRNNRTINGGIMAGNNIQLENKTDVNALNQNVAWNPADTNPPSGVIVGGWLR